MKELVLKVIDDIDSFEKGSRTELSNVESLMALSANLPSLKYYIDNKLLSYPFDQVDNDDIESLKWHVNYYFDLYKD